VTLKLICKNDLVYIPNAFTPNNDLLNDRFVLKGSGIKNIRSIVIYNRAGKLMFERKNINVNDSGNSWDGTFKGDPMPGGAYVYLLQTECEGGDIFEYKGTLLLIR
jgi:gliding motility-associated-like protein